MRKLLRISGWILGSILLMILCILIILHTPYGKDFVRKQALNFIRSKVDTEVQIGRINYLLPKRIELNDVFFRDEANDTLLAVRQLRIDINPLTLLYGKLTIPAITLQGITAHVYRHAPDTAFNFTYLIHAFAGNEPEPSATTTAPKQEADSGSSSSMSFDIGRLTLGDIHIRFDDHTGGTRLALDLDELLLSMNRTDITTLDFGIDQLKIKGLTSSFIQDTSWLPPSPDTGSAASFQLAANKVTLDKIAFSYFDNISQSKFDINLNHLLLQPRTIDIAGQRIDIAKLVLDTTQINMLTAAAAETADQPEQVTDTGTTQSWHVTAGDMQLAAISFKMDDPSAPRQPHGMDYSHLDIHNLNFRAEDLYYTTDSISGHIKHLSVQERSGLDLRELRTRFAYHTRGAILDELYLATGGTILKDHLEISYPSLQTLQTDPGALFLNLKLEESKLSISDILLFVPDLKKQDFFAQHQHQSLQLDATVNGYMNDLNIPKLHLAGLDKTEAILSGKLRGLPDADKLSYDLEITRIQSANRDLTPLFPASLQQQIRLPDLFGISGRVSGTTQDYNAELALMTSEGNAFLKGYIHMSPGKNREQYDLQLKADRLHLGHILRQDSLMGRISADFSVKGKSFDVQNMHTELRGAIHLAQIKGYDYNSIRLSGDMSDGAAQIRLLSDDPNAQLSLAAIAGFNDSFPSVIADLTIDSMDLQALQLSAGAFKIRTHIHADVPVANPDYPQAAVIFGGTILLIENQRHLIDSMSVVSAPTPDSSQQITAYLDALYASVTGHIPLTKAGAAIQNHISRHYALNATDSTGNITDSTSLPEQYDLQLTANITNRPLLQGFVPELTKLDTVHIHAALDENNLELNLTAAEIIYGANRITGVAANINGLDSALNYKVGVARVAQTNFELINTTIEGQLAQNEITAALRIRDTSGTEQFHIAVAMHQQDSDQIISLQPNLLIHYKPWQVATSNQIVLGTEGFYATGFDISNGNKYIRIASEAPAYNAPLTLEVANLSIGELTRIVSKRDTLLADGTLTVKLNLQQIKPDMLLTASVDIQELSVMNTTIGDLRVDAANSDAGTLNAEMTILGQGNDIRLTGAYYMKPTGGNDFNMDLLLNAIDLQSMEGLAMNQIRNSSGLLRGKLNIQGTAQKPVITGDIRTDQLTTTVSMLGMQYRFPDEQILFREDEIRLDGFDILDSAGNKITLGGSIATRDLPNMQLALNVRAKNFKALSSTIRDNKSFYGSVVISTDLNIKGSVSAPDIGGSIGIERGTAFTAVLPESEVKLRESDGIVEFIDADDTSAYALLPTADTTEPSVMAINTGGDINLNISIDSAAEFRLIVDPGTGDYLRVRGLAALNAAVTPGGDLTLTGTYEIREGAYQLNYNMIRRRFDIAAGSNIRFAGDPLDADMDITAIYEANIAPYDLVERQVPDPSQLNFYKQRLPFDIHLKMRGELMQPFISFDIDLPEGKNYRMAAEGVDLVQARLNQLRTDTSELNKQVFAVLILNRFIGEDPFASEGGGVSTVARQSASRFISEQLNRYASGLIKGVDLNFDLASSEDYTTGERRERTDLSIAASKALFNDRLTVTIGNDFALEGPQSNSQENASLIPGNLAADYRLTQDGRYMLRAYRRDQNEGVMQGFITETGVNFITTHEYNRFRNLFNRKRRAREWAERAAHAKEDEKDNQEQ